METATVGLYVLGGFTAFVALFAIALSLGKKYHEEDEAKKVL